MQTHRDVFIVLKKSLKWVPVVGWGMQFFNFIFLARSWASDRVQLASDLSALGRQAEQQDKPLTLILYPEGTLVSKDTRRISKGYADKIGTPDMLNTLLPRSMGLHYSLRSLSPRIPSLRLIDITMSYPGIPPAGYGQSYYTLRSIFCDGVPPPVIHVHLRMFDVASEVPIGNVLASNRSDSSLNTHAVEVDIPEAEKARFDLWLRELWQDKDRMMSDFLESGSLGDSKASVLVPLKLRKKSEIFDAFCFLGPAVVCYVWARAKPW